MNQPERDQSRQKASQKADDPPVYIGQRIGYFTALTALRLQKAISAPAAKTKRVEQVNSHSTNSKVKGTTRTSMQESGQQTREKAEEIVDRVGQRISLYTALAGWQLQRTLARVREEAEDLWAEAQHIRQQKGNRPL
ncbi:hypothetical protein EPA93_02930 [Ktedonosporobacter rubrisoli]|uniref:Uncharacterized protein n=1 Tax=Ktedonosporobacter rubrisoli TaxID=2509675 RepID=A0A4P6JJB0_KTERU|nr:hypothetical protein [Ktedonosporobacter rubrisoli]QBD75002.1 hypothetical protein EPA93_02930 [Ktedonosporobacter rubrisoli]